MNYKIKNILLLFSEKVSAFLSKAIAKSEFLSFYNRHRRCGAKHTTICFSYCKILERNSGSGSNNSKEYIFVI